MQTQESLGVESTGGLDKELDDELDDEEGVITLESHLISEEENAENSAPEELEHVIYPTQESSSDVWELPSGRFGKDVIRTLPKNAQRYQWVMMLQ